jgi:hypothetical protein
MEKGKGDGAWRGLCVIVKGISLAYRVFSPVEDGNFRARRLRMAKEMAVSIEYCTA